MRILLVQSGGLGDLVLFSPSIIALRQEYPDSEISLLVENRAYNGCQELFHNLVDEVIEFDFQNARSIVGIFRFWCLLIQGYDCVISNGSSPVIALLLSISGARTTIGYKSLTSSLLTHSVPLNKNQYAAHMLFDLVKPILSDKSVQPVFQKILDAKLNKYLDKPYILLHPGASKTSIDKGIIKTPNSQFWAELIIKLAEEAKDKNIILIGGPDDREISLKIKNQIQKDIPSFIDLTELSLSISEMSGFIEHSEQFICVDSAPMHIAVMLNANIVALFGPTDHKKLIPSKDNFKVVKTNNLLCQPCLWGSRKKSCQVPICVNDLSIETVMKSLNL